MLHNYKVSPSNAAYSLPNPEQISDLLQDLLSGSLSVTETADTLAAPVEEAYVYGWVTEELHPRRDQYEIWNQVLKISQSLPHDDKSGAQRLLVELLGCLKQRPDPDVTPEIKMKIYESDLWHADRGTLWNKLGTYPWELRRCADSWLPDTPLPQEHDSHQQISMERYLNFQAFNARMTAAGVDNSIFLGLGMFRWGIEGELGGPRDKNVAISAAAVWMLYAGSWMFDHINDRNGEGIVTYVPKHQVGSSNSDWDGPIFTINQKRWNFWKDVFGRANTAHGMLKQNTMRLMKQAFDAMQDIDMSLS